MARMREFNVHIAENNFLYDRQTEIGITRIGLGKLCWRNVFNKALQSVFQAIQKSFELCRHTQQKLKKNMKLLQSGSIKAWVQP